MRPGFDLLTTAAAPTIWGTTYLVTTELLPPGVPLTVAMWRALPAGLLLLAFVRRLPHGVWWARTLLLGTLNISLFQTLLFISAYRLPGGVAATLGALQPLLVIVLSRFLLARPLRALTVVAAAAGLGGVALLVLTPQAALDAPGVAAGLGGAAAMALGTVLSRRWQPPVSALTFTAWQLTAGGLLLAPAALLFEPRLGVPSAANLLGFGYLTLIGAALTYALWFRGIARLEPSVVSSLGFLSPLTAVLLGWAALGQTLTLAQAAGMGIVVFSVWLSQRAAAAPTMPRAGTAT